MKKLLLLLVTICTLTAKSQTSVYHPFPEDTATWVTDIYYNTCMGYCSSIFYEMKGDTIINSQSYNKIYQRSGRFYYIVWPPNSVVGADSFSACSYIGAIRQDSINKKVYYIDSTMTTDTLLYDFNLSIGDTVQSWYIKWSSQPWQLIVTGIDSISLNGSFHKRINFTQGNSLIEGVGWASELFGLKVVSNMYVALACFDGNVIVQEAFLNECDVSLNCDIFVDINEQNGKKDFSLFPNPFSDKLNFTINNQEYSEIILFDIASRELLQQKFTNTVTLNTGQLAKGMYLYEVRNKNGLVKKGKVVKE